MLPGPPFSARQKKVILVTSGAVGCFFGALDLLLGAGVNDLTLLALAGIVIASAGFAYIGWPVSDRLPAGVRHGRDSAVGGHGLEAGAEAGPTPTPAGRPLVLRAVARLMPPAAGRRWLAEADSVLFEVATGRRGKAVRSYVLSAPRLVVLMWAAELPRRVRARFRRPR
jgi:hypothetical protein